MARLRTETAILQSLEVFRYRTGSYPETLGQLIDSGIWPEARARALSEFDYRPLPQDLGYAWGGKDRPRIVSTASGS